MQQPPNQPQQPYPSQQPYTGQPYPPQQPYPNQQPYTGQPYPPQQPYTDQPYLPQQPYPNQQPYDPTIQPQQPPKKKGGAAKGCGIAAAIVLVIIIIAVIASASHGSGSTPNTSTSSTTSTSTASQSPTQASATAHKVGDNVSIDGWGISVDNLKTSQDDPLGQLKSGDVYLEVSISLKNNTGQNQTFSSLLFFSMTDSTGQKYDQSLTSGVPSPDGAVANGNPLKGTLSYEVPATTKAFILTFTPSLGSTDTATWNLSL